jgi:hypothetical protein
MFADFLMPPRLDAYRQLVEAAIAAGYQVCSVAAFWELVKRGSVGRGLRYMILRHDVDTDPATAGDMHRVDQRLGVHGSYFFRLSTVDHDLMRAMADAGDEASYHYEELATLIKRRRLRDRSAVIRAIPEARSWFRENLAALRAATELPIRIVAAHGDFANRAVGVTNTELLSDPAFRIEVGVELETGDPAFMDWVSSRHSDTHHPRYWMPPGDPLAAITAGVPVIYVLVHPRHWRADRIVNARDDARRMWEGLSYRFGPTPRHERPGIGGRAEDPASERFTGPGG